jgi:hypothetical protein
MAQPASPESIYTDAQINAYLKRISFPEEFPKISPHETQTTQTAFHYLSEPQCCHLTTVPLENLDIHYPVIPTISLNIQVLL